MVEHHRSANGDHDNRDTGHNEAFHDVPPASTALASPTAETPATPGATAEGAPTPAAWPPPAGDAPGGLIAEPATGDQRAAAQALLDTVYPPADLVALAESLGGVPGPIPRVVATAPADWQVGDQADFWLLNNDTIVYSAVPMELRAVGEHAYLWFDLNTRVGDSAARQAAADFDDIYERDRAAFGSEPNPGIDGDPRLYILNSNSSRIGRGAGGFLDSSSQLPQAASPNSNEHELFVMNLDFGTPGGDEYARILAHEFQHMIHGNYDASDEQWVVEGSAVYAEDALGYHSGPLSFADAYLANPDQPLNLGVGVVDYGYGFLFIRYLAARFGTDFVRDWLQRPEDGLVGLDVALAEAGQGVTAEEAFAAWLAGNLIGDNAQAGPEYQFPGLGFSPVRPSSPGRLPATLETDVNQYAADYYALASPDDLRVEFRGSTRVRPIGDAPHSGERYWWSGRGNQSDSTLTREFDLTGAASATLNYWVWFDIEDGWDYGYLVVSTDGGETWQGLETPGMTDYDPQEQTYTDRFYTGSSGGEWVEETADLTPFAGQTILLRFEYVTDPLVAHAGWAIDDLSIPEIGYYDDFESESGWQAAGFNNVTAYLPQAWSVQLVTFEAGAPQVAQIELTDGVKAAFDVAANSDSVLIIAALAPATVEAGVYELKVE